METTIATGEEGWLATCFDTSDVERSDNCGLSCTMVRSDNTDEQKENKVASKPHSTPLTLKWLEENYELAEGVCIPRNTLYIHYLDFCEKNSSQPVNAASFGKIIRQQFPHLTTRRLGTRGQSRYHYYGIGVKESSAYYDVMYSRKGINNRPPDGRKEPIRQMVTYSPRSKLGTLLPEFPNIKDFKLPPDITMEKVTTFLMMYRTHCQRILDTVIRANFDEVQSFLLHFWQGMPQHIVPILGTNFIVNLVGVCDAILYKAISAVLMPTVLQALPDSLTQVIRKFARQLDEWLRVALQGMPELLTQIKLDLSRRFAQMLKRQTSLNHLCQASRTVIHSADITTQMLDDWRHIDLNSICKQTLYTLDTYSERDHQIIINLYKEFERLLHEQAPLDAYVEWLDAMVNACVIQAAACKPGSLRRIARQFLLMWSCFGTRVIRDMTLHSAPSFGSFHLLHLMFDDYVLFHVEMIHAQERSNDLLRLIRGEDKLADHEEDALPRPHFSESYVIDNHINQTNSSGVMATDRQTVITDTREAYGNTSQYITSPHPNSAHGGESPSHSSMTSYDNRGESDMQLSPVDGESRPYMRYGTMSDSTATSGDMAANYQYTSAPVNSSQYSYSQRDYSRGGDWSDKYTSLTTNVTSYQQTTAQYGSNYSYGRDFDATNYPGYDVNAYPSPMRTHPQVNTYFGQYGSDVRSCVDNSSTDVSTRKRKSGHEGERDYCIKRNNSTSTNNYDYGMAQNYSHVTIKPI